MKNTKKLTFWQIVTVLLFTGTVLYNYAGINNLLVSMLPGPLNYIVYYGFGRPISEIRHFFEHKYSNYRLEKQWAEEDGQRERWLEEVRKGSAGNTYNQPTNPDAEQSVPGRFGNTNIRFPISPISWTLSGGNTAMYATGYSGP